MWLTRIMGTQTDTVQCNYSLIMQHSMLGQLWTATLLLWYWLQKCLSNWVIVRWFTTKYSVCLCLPYMSQKDWEVLAWGAVLQRVCSSPFMDYHHVRLARSLSCSNYESLCQWKLLHSSSSLYDWQALWCYCYLEHTVPFLWWRYQIAYGPDAFLLFSACSEKGTAVVRGVVYVEAWTTARSSLSREQPVPLLWCWIDGS